MNNQISLLKIIEDTIVDGPGFRTSIYGAGCSHHCKGCHNPLSWHLEDGRFYNIDAVAEKALNSSGDVTFSGGDPFYQIDAFTRLAGIIKEKSDKSIWCYTGYLFEDILKKEKFRQILPFIDVLVDGPFIQEQLDLDLVFKGSRNQRIIDIGRSLKYDKIELFDYNPFPVF